MRTLEEPKLIKCPSTVVLNDDQKRRVSENIDSMGDQSIKKLKLNDNTDNSSDEEKPKFRFGIPSSPPNEPALFTGKIPKGTFGPPSSSREFYFGPRGRFKKALEHFKSKELKLLDLKGAKNVNSNFYAKDQNKHFY